MQLAVSTEEYHRQCVLAANSSRLSPSSLDPREYKLLSGWIAEKQKADYLLIRNGILRLWTRNPLVSVTQEEAISCAKNASQYSLALVAFEWLARHGYINFGCVEIPGPAKYLSSTASKSKTIIIIGAGVAGLACARQLQGLCTQFRDRLNLNPRQNPPRVVVLEGRGRIGGRVYSHPLATQQKGTLPHGLANTAEMGAHIITGFDSGNPLDAVVRGQLALEHHSLRDRLLLHDFDGSVIVDEQRDARMDKLFNLVLEIASKHSWKLVEKAAPHQLPTENGHSAPSPKVNGLNGTNGAHKIPSTLGTLGAMMDELIEEYRGQEPLSPLDLRLLNWHYANLEYANAANVSQLSLGGWDQDGGNEFEGRHSQVVGGYSQLPRALLRYPTPLDVRLNKAVSAITYDVQGVSGEKPKAQVVCEDGDVVDADYLISTLPLGVLQERSVSFNPPLPDWKAGAMQRLGFGLLNKVILVFDQVFWEKDRDMFGLLNDSLVKQSMDQKDYVLKRGKFYLFWNCVKTSGLPVLIALMAGDAAWAAEKASDQVVVADVLDQLKKIFKWKAAAEPKLLEAIVTRWKKDRFARGSYSYIGPTALPGDYEAMARPVGNLFFAGEATCITHPATVHGAYISGLRVASEVLEDLIGPIPVPNV